MPRTKKSVSEALSGRHNSFGALRLAFAATVIYSHAFPLSGRGSDPAYTWWQNQAHFGSLAVFGFLGISGYVVTKSAMRLTPGRFAWHRVLRLYPAYWVALLVGALIFAPIAWVASGRELSAFWQEPEGPLSYLTRNAALWVQQWGIHDIFNGAINGSLWTLAYELMCYILIGALAAWGVLSHSPKAIPIIALVFGAMTVVTRSFPQFFATYVGVLDDSMVSLGWVFMLGATAAVYGDRIPMRNSYATIAIMIIPATLWFGGFHAIGIPAFVYATIWAATALPSIFHRVGQKNDYSYGVYLYGWPVQAALVAAGLSDKMMFFLPLSLIGAAGLAWLSWHLVEKPAMRLKDRREGRASASPSNPSPTQDRSNRSTYVRRRD